MQLENSQVKDIFCDFALAKRLENAEGSSAGHFVDARAAVSLKSGAERINVGGAYVLFDGIESPITQTFGLGMSEAANDAVLEEIESFFKRHNSAVFHEVSPLAGVELYALLTGRGYKPIEVTSVMFKPVESVVTKRSFKTRPIRDDERKLWAETAAAGWENEMPGLKEFMLDLGNVIAHKTDSVEWFAELDGFSKPVATASVSLSDGVALMAGASTIPEARNQGAQSALLAARLNYASENGCDLAMMCAAPGSSSQKNAERNGFRIAYTRLKWELR